jgi:hypothetical protein
MLNNIRANESLQVLLFVCVPLLLVLIAFVALLIRGSKRTATFPTFSVAISKVSHDFGRIIYRDGSKTLEFDAQIGRGSSFFVARIRVCVPKELSNEDVSDVVPKLALGLTRLHRQYLIYRPGEPQEIPKEERDAAIAELQRMGFEFDSAAAQGQVQRALTRDWRLPSGKQAKVAIPKLLSLMTKARGIRETHEVLASSNEARL